MTFERDRQYWLRQLADAPDKLRLPYDFPLSDDSRLRRKNGELTLPGSIVTRVRALAMRNHTTLSSVMLALFKLLLFQLSKQEDMCIGMSIANRNHPDLENLIGFFVNILPIRTRLSADVEFDALLNQVTENVQEAFEHQDLPFDLLIETLNPDRISNRQPLLNVIYAFQNFDDVRIDIGLNSKGADSARKQREPGRIKAFDVSFETSKFDLTLFVTDMREGLLLSLEYDTGLFRPEAIRRNLLTLQRFAKAVANQNAAEASAP